MSGDGIVHSILKAVRRLKPPADASSILLKLFIVCPGREPFFEPHLHLDQHDAHDESKQREGVGMTRKSPVRVSIIPAPFAPEESELALLNRLHFRPAHDAD
jgi:hypothetical protein